jgi:hypothetical protein
MVVNDEDLSIKENYRMRQSGLVAVAASEALEVPLADPVFVLCHGRSGSTLLRFLLDTHPDLACPPETNLPALCVQLATVWSLIEGAPLSVNRGDEPPLIPDAAISGIRDTMDRMLGSYLARRDKMRYCDKSLGTARFAELLLRVYPEARFICLYRHPMDVVASGIEAAPWGLTGFGFDPYIAATPGNAVLALARFWADSTIQIRAVEDQFPERCIRVRYEDLVTNPEGTAAAIFKFLGVGLVPGISSACFSPERERFGPGDHKIWYTSKISSGSVGRGWSIPAELVGPEILSAINELTSQLGYMPVNDDWGNSAPPRDLRLPVSDPDPGAATAGPHHSGGASTALPGASRAKPGGSMHSQTLGNRLRSSLEDVDPEATGRWGDYATETMVAVSVPADPHQSAEYWRVDLKNRALTFVTDAAREDSDWDIIGSNAAWDQVITGKLNLSIAIRSCQLRYCDSDETTGVLAADSRIAILGELLGLPRWQSPSAQHLSAHHGTGS